jgi:glycosyltransferase involved in cell wall biosynthesis
MSDGELKSLYAHATAFVFPSLYEGFGLPPLEAMICGCPVIVSDIPPHREVCGEAALYCNPHDIDDIAQKILSVMSNTGLRHRLSEKGHKRAANFNWRKSAAEFHKDIVETFT